MEVVPVWSGWMIMMMFKLVTGFLPGVQVLPWMVLGPILGFGNPMMF